LRAKFWFLSRRARNDVEDQLDCGADWIGGIKELEEFDELSTAVTVSEQGMDLASEQINPSQQANRAVTFVLMITREGRVDARFQASHPPQV
jgi:hypothetical protein